MTKPVRAADLLTRYGIGLFHLFRWHCGRQEFTPEAFVSRILCGEVYPWKRECLNCGNRRKLFGGVFCQTCIADTLKFRENVPHERDDGIE